MAAPCAESVTSAVRAGDTTDRRFRNDFVAQTLAGVPRDARPLRLTLPYEQDLQPTERGASPAAQGKGMMNR
jgi:hypothetical protein